MHPKAYGGVNRRAFDDAKKLYRVAFNGAFNTTSTRTVDLLTFKMDGSNDVEERFAVLDGTDVPAHRDQLHYGDYVLYSFDTESETYAKGIRFKRDDFQADKMGMFTQLGAALGTHIATSKRKRAVDYLVRGFTDTHGTTYDGQTLFDTTHVTANGQTWSNAHNLALSESAFKTVYASLISAPSPDGNQLYESHDGEIKVHLIVGPELKATADAIVQETLANGATNPLKDRATVVTLSDLRAGGDFDAFKNYWFMQAVVESMGEMRPLTLLEFAQPELEFLFEGEEAFEKDSYKVKTRGNYGLGYRAPWAIQGSSGGA